MIRAAMEKAQSQAPVDARPEMTYAQYAHDCIVREERIREAGERSRENAARLRNEAQVAAETESAGFNWFRTMAGNVWDSFKCAGCCANSIAPNP